VVCGDDVDLVEVDGSMGEGGGQILRTAVAFSVILGRSVRIFNIRAGRDVPGLRRQHVSTLRVLRDVFGGELKGAFEGSSDITFVPRRQRIAALSVDMGTAASITLVLQAVIPAVALTGSTLNLDIIGGTDVPWSPTLDYFQRVVCEAYKAIGISFDLAASRRGYYPRGGGRVSVKIEPAASLKAIDMSERPSVNDANLISRCANLPKHVAERQLNSAISFLESAGIHVVEKELWVEEALSPGSSLLAYSNGSGWMLGEDGIGAKGRAAEDVGASVAKKFLDALASGACVDSNLADMVVPLLMMAPSKSRIRVESVTSHLKSGLDLGRQFTSSNWSIEDAGTSSYVNVHPCVSKAGEIGHNV
jgi:RNA 3'-phosphate cyclase